jgi:hypothetical protein
MKATLEISANLGSEQIDHQRTYPGGEAGATSVALAPPDRSTNGPVYFCRGCGTALPEGFRGHFHRECLRADKRQRVRNRRAQESRRFSTWARQLECPHCGKRHGNRALNLCPASSCEASQCPKEGEKQKS